MNRIAKFIIAATTVTADSSNSGEKQQKTKEYGFTPLTDIKSFDSTTLLRLAPYITYDNVLSALARRSRLNNEKSKLELRNWVLDTYRNMIDENAEISDTYTQKDEKRIRQAIYIIENAYNNGYDSHIKQLKEECKKKKEKWLEINEECNAIIAEQKKRLRLADELYIECQSLILNFNTLFGINDDEIAEKKKQIEDNENELEKVQEQLRRLKDKRQTALDFYRKEKEKLREAIESTPYNRTFNSHEKVKEEIEALEKTVQENSRKKFNIGSSKKLSEKNKDELIKLLDREIKEIKEAIDRKKDEYESTKNTNIHNLAKNIVDSSLFAKYSPYAATLEWLTQKCGKGTNPSMKIVVDLDSPPTYEYNRSPQFQEAIRMLQTSSSDILYNILNDIYAEYSVHPNFNPTTVDGTTYSAPTSIRYNDIDVRKFGPTVSSNANYLYDPESNNFVEVGMGEGNYRLDKNTNQYIPVPTSKGNYIYDFSTKQYKQVAEGKGNYAYYITSVPQTGKAQLHYNISDTTTYKPVDSPQGTHILNDDNEMEESSRGNYRRVESPEQFVYSSGGDYIYNLKTKQFERVDKGQGNYRLQKKTEYFKPTEGGDYAFNQQTKQYVYVGKGQGNYKIIHDIKFTPIEDKLLTKYINEYIKPEYYGKDNLVNPIIYVWYRQGDFLFKLINNNFNNLNSVQQAINSSLDKLLSKIYLVVKNIEEINKQQSVLSPNWKMYLSAFNKTSFDNLINRAKALLDKSKTRSAEQKLLKSVIAEFIYIIYQQIQQMELKKNVNDQRMIKVLNLRNEKLSIDTPQINVENNEENNIDVSKIKTTISGLGKELLDKYNFSRFKDFKGVIDPILIAWEENFHIYDAARTRADNEVERDKQTIRNNFNNNSKLSFTRKVDAINNRAKAKIRKLEAPKNWSDEKKKQFLEANNVTINFDIAGTRDINRAIKEIQIKKIVKESEKEFKNSYNELYKYVDDIYATRKNYVGFMNQLIRHFIGKVREIGQKINAAEKDNDIIIRWFAPEKSWETNLYNISNNLDNFVKKLQSGEYKNFTVAHLVNILEVYVNKLGGSDKPYHDINVQDFKQMPGLDIEWDIYELNNSLKEAIEEESSTFLNVDE